VRRRDSHIVRDDLLKDGGEIVSLTCWQSFTPRHVSGTHF
jgi:hypothetical protein